MIRVSLLTVIGRAVTKESVELCFFAVFHIHSCTVGQRGRGRGSGPGRGRGMLNKNKKLKGKPWGGRGRGRGDMGMEDMGLVSTNPDVATDSK